MSKPPVRLVILHKRRPTLVKKWFQKCRRGFVIMDADMSIMTGRVQTKIGEVPATAG
jgi:hypothetical protein